MQISMTVKLKGRVTNLGLEMDRRAAYRWVSINAEAIEELDIVAGVNSWAWSATMGWVQYPQINYGRNGIVRRPKKPIRHGNDFYSQHPWTFCMQDLITPNPLSAEAIEASNLF